MQIESFFNMFFGFLRSLFEKLGEYHVSAFGVNVSITALLGAFIILSMVIGIFWKGAQG